MNNFSRTKGNQTCNVSDSLATLLRVVWPKRCGVFVAGQVGQ